MLTLTGLLICTSEAQAASVRAHADTHIRLSRAEPGCLSFTLQQTDDPMVWQVDEAFTDRAAFEAHQTRTASSDWGQATKAIKRDFTLHEA